MKIVIIEDVETGEIWYYIVHDGDAMPSIVESKTIRSENSDEDEDVTH